jgi:hypothetical protein
MRRAGRRWLLVMLAFGIFGAAMFAEPAVAEIEKVIGLSQVKRSQCRVSVVQEPTPDHLKAGCY